MAGKPIDPTELYKTPPPELGHAVLKYFGFDPNYLNLNNGSFGSLPTPVLAACNTLTLEIERHPDHFLRLLYQPLLQRVREQVAELIGADTDECVIVPNASHGINTVLRNFEWEKEDILVACNTTYGSISRTVHYLSDIPPHPSVSEFTILFPTTHSTIVSIFRNHIRSLVRSKTTNPRRKIVAVIDSISSVPGVLMPWKQMVKICKEEGVWSVIDAAHSIGQEMNINLAEVQPDFWISNCHKWLHAKRGCAILYVPKRNQHIIKSTIPTSHAYVSSSSGDPPKFLEQFEWNGTIDWVPYLSVTPALEFRNWLGGEAKINAYCHKVAIEGGKRLAEVMRTRVLDPDGDLTVNMVNVELPFPANIEWTEEISMLFTRKLLEEHNVYSAHFAHNGRWWTRCSVQVYNEVADFEKIGHIYVQICKEIVDELGLNVQSKL